MDDGLKQRLVGAVVVCAVAVILLPSLFQRTERRIIDRTTTIPLRPAVEPVIPIEPVQPPAMRTLDDPETVFVADPENDRSSTKEEGPALDSEGLAKAWVLQVASFTDPERADNLTVRLGTMGYKAYVAKAKTAKGYRYRVNVGPQIDKNDAIRIKGAVDKALKVDSLLLKYHP